MFFSVRLGAPYFLERRVSAILVGDITHTIYYFQAKRPTPLTHDFVLWGKFVLFLRRRTPTIVEDYLGQKKGALSRLLVFLCVNAFVCTRVLGLPEIIY